MQALSRMLELRLAKGLVGVSGMSTPVRNPKESQESPGSMWPKDLINLEAGETAWQVLKIRELSPLVGREGEGRKEERGGGEERGRREGGEQGGKRVSQSLLGGQEIRLSVLQSYVSLLGLIPRLCSAGGDGIFLSPSSSLPTPPLGVLPSAKLSG